MQSRIVFFYCRIRLIIIGRLTRYCCLIELIAIWILKAETRRRKLTKYSRYLAQYRVVQWKFFETVNSQLFEDRFVGFPLRSSRLFLVTFSFLFSIQFSTLNLQALYHIYFGCCIIPRFIFWTKNWIYFETEVSKNGNLLNSLSFYESWAFLKSSLLRAPIISAVWLYSISPT